MILSSAILKAHHSLSIIVHNNLTVFCINGGRLKLQQPIIIEGITWIGCGAVDGTTDDLLAAVTINSISTSFTIKKCSFHYSIGIAISITILSNSHIKVIACNFENNNYNYRGHGAAIRINHFAFQRSIFL